MGYKIIWAKLYPWVVTHNFPRTDACAIGLNKDQLMHLCKARVAHFLGSSEGVIFYLVEEINFAIYYLITVHPFM